MKVQLEDSEYKITFAHPSRVLGRKKKRRVSECTITDLADGEVVAFDMVVCHPCDTFEKAEGRKRALTAALKDGGFNRLERTRIWKTYFKFHRKP